MRKQLCAEWCVKDATRVLLACISSHGSDSLSILILCILVNPDLPLLVTGHRLCLEETTQASGLGLSHSLCLGFSWLVWRSWFQLGVSLFSLKSSRWM